MDRKVGLKSLCLGFTMLELLIVLAIVAILSGIVISEILSYIDKARLRSALNQFLSDLNYVKNQAQITGVAWGIRACTGTNQYKVFVDPDGDCRDSNDTNDPNDPCKSNSTKICLNNPDQNCTNDTDCPFALVGSCVQLEMKRELEGRIIFTKGNTTRHFYVVFDRKGFAFNHLCGVGANNITIQSSSGKFTIFVDRFGRIRVE